ncbi:MAG: alpha/beta fold hydrolase [Anaerolineae bacterium]
MNWDLIYRGETRDLDDSVRAAAGGSFIHVQSGCTHYELAGPEGRRPVVLIHGFSVPFFIWDTTFASLVAAGHRLLRYDLLGRGYSDRPRVRYDLALFVRQLAELLDGLNIAQADLIGLSMGGVIATAFTVRFPQRVRRLALLAPIGSEPMPLNLLFKPALLPGISELALGLLRSYQMVQNLASDFFDPKEVERFIGQYRSQMQFRGFKRAILSTVRNGVVNGSPESYDSLGRLDLPVLLIWGRDDRTLPLAQSAPILNRVPRAEFHVIDGAGHIPNVERADVVQPLLLDFLERT